MEREQKSKMSFVGRDVASALQPEGAPCSVQAPILVLVAADRSTDITMPNGLFGPAIDFRSKNQAAISTNIGVCSHIDEKEVRKNVL